MRILSPGTGQPKRVLLLQHDYDYRHHAGVARFAAQAGWALEDAFTPVQGLPEAWLGNGVISCRGSSHATLDWLRKARQDHNVPVVEIADNAGGLGGDVPRVMTDDQRIAQLAAEHFATRGYDNIGFAWEFDSPLARRRRAALAGEAAARGLRFWDVPFERIAQLRAQEAFPIGLLTESDLVAVRALRACADAAVPVPERVAVLGIDNFTWRCEAASVPLSSVDPDYERAGYEAAAILNRLMNAPQDAAAPEEPDPVRVPPLGVVERESTRMLAVRDEEVAKALRFIAHNAQRPVGLRDVAQVTDLSLRRLQGRFKAQLGHTILQEINGRRVERAQELLRETAKKVRVVAAECGFGNSMRLIRIFKQYTGVSPMAFRKQVAREGEERPVENAHDRGARQE